MPRGKKGAVRGIPPPVGGGIGGGFAGHPWRPDPRCAMRGRARGPGPGWGRGCPVDSVATAFPPSPWLASHLAPRLVDSGLRCSDATGRCTARGDRFTMSLVAPSRAASGLESGLAAVGGTAAGRPG